MAGVGAVAIVFLVMFYLAILAVAVVMYVLNAIGLMKMAKSCGIANPWMAFVPFASSYLMGKIAEQNPSNGRKSWPWRHLALIGEIVIFAMAIAFGVWMGVDMVASGVLEGAEYSEFDVLTMYGGMVGFMGIYSLLSMVYNVIIYIIYWKIFSLFAPEWAVVFLILSLLLTVAPILFFILRNRQPVNRPGPTNEQWV